MSDLSVETLTEESQFARVSDRWEALYERVPTATPFLAHGWLSAYWRAFGDQDSLRVVCVSAPDGRLVAAAPLRVRRRRRMSVLTPIGDEMADFSDLLIDPATPEAAEALAGGVVSLPGWDILDLPEVPPGASLWRLLEVWPGQATLRDASTCLELPAGPADTVLAALPAKQRHELRRQINRADRLGLRAATVPADPDEVRDAIGELLDLHARQWAGRPVNGLHLTGAFRRHITASIQVLAPAGRAALTRHLLGGEVAAVSLILLTGDLAGGYLYGVDPTLFTKVDVATMMIRSDLELAHARGASRLSLLRGVEAAKLRWLPVQRRNRQLLLLPPRLGLGHAAATARLIGRAARERAGSFTRTKRIARRVLAGVAHR
jgi:CelD/BcsL family acetyltransferase involved in cellulose biosynthesis